MANQAIFLVLKTYRIKTLSKENSIAFRKFDKHFLKAQKK